MVKATSKGGASTPGNFHEDTQLTFLAHVEGFSLSNPFDSAIAPDYALFGLGRLKNVEGRPK